MPEPIWEQAPEETTDVPQVANEMVPLPTPTQTYDPPQNEPVKVPAMLRRLFPCYLSGKTEAIVEPEDGGRPRRSRRGVLDL